MMSSKSFPGHEKRIGEKMYVYADSVSYPVFFQDGVGDKRIKISLKCPKTEKEYEAYISDSSGDVLCVAAGTTSVDSQEFRQWLTSQVKIRNDISGQPIFYLGKTKFTVIEKTVSRVDSTNFTCEARKMVGDLTEVTKIMGDQKLQHERQLWNSQAMYDALENGFSHMQNLAVLFYEQEVTVEDQRNQLIELKMECKKLSNELKTSDAVMKTRLDQVEGKIHEQVQESSTVFSDAIGSIKHENKLLALKVQELQVVQQEQMELWKKVYSQQQLQLNAANTTCQELKKEIEGMKMERNDQTNRVKDTWRVINDAQMKTTNQMNIMKGEMHHLYNLRRQQEAHSHTIHELKDMYLQILPKLEQAYVSERRREASEAVQHLNRMVRDDAGFSKPANFLETLK